MSLRSKVIRLAASNPDLRPHLLPLLKNASWSNHDQYGRAMDAWEERVERDLRSLGVPENDAERASFTDVGSKIRGNEAHLVEVRTSQAAEVASLPWKTVERLTNTVLLMEADGNRLLVWCAGRP
jgi:hypothetical protein